MWLTSIICRFLPRFLIGNEMIGQSRGAYVFIRTFIFFLRSIAPFSILYWLLRVSILPEILHLPFLLEFVAATEVLFYFLVFLPRNHLFQNPAVHPVVPPRAERRELFRKCLDTVPDIKEFIKLGSREPRNKIRRDNVKEWLCWAFLNKATWNADEDAELDDYLKEIEGLLGEELPPGRGQVQSLRITLDKFHTLHRPLIWYIVSLPRLYDLLRSLCIANHNPPKNHSSWSAGTISSLMYTFYTTRSISTAAHYQTSSLNSLSAGLNSSAVTSHSRVVYHTTIARTPPLPVSPWS